jgi:hypothetical protein
MISNLCCGLFLPCNQKIFSKSLLTTHHLSLEAGPFFTYWKHFVFITHVTTFFHFVILVWNWSQGSTSSRTSICSCFFASISLKTSTCFQLIDKVFWTRFPLKVNVEFGSSCLCLFCLLKFLQHCEVIMLNNHAKFLVCICNNNSIR